jgi:hypothetical protein
MADICSCGGALPLPGGCKAALLWHPNTPGVTNLWLNDIREVRDKNAAALEGLSTDAAWDKYVALAFWDCSRKNA